MPLLIKNTFQKRFEGIHRSQSESQNSVDLLISEKFTKTRNELVIDQQLGTHGLAMKIILYFNEMNKEKLL